MAGHSKWKNIRLQKGKADIQRGKLFGKLSREITIAAKMGGGNPDSNPRLRLAVEKARDASMPADNIKRAIQKGTGELGGEDYEEILYEGYGPGGVAVLVETATDNRNRTVADLRHLFSKYGGNLGENGSVAWQFERKGVLTVPAADRSEDEVLEAALEAGAEDLRNEGEYFTVTTSPESLSAVRDALETRSIAVESAEAEMVAQNTVEPSPDHTRSLLKLLDALDDHDDVQRVASNAEISDEVLAES